MSRSLVYSRLGAYASDARSRCESAQWFHRAVAVQQQKSGASARAAAKASANRCAVSRERVGPTAVQLYVRAAFAN